MSKMSDVDLEIQQLLEHGFNPRSIAVRLSVPLTWVYDVLEAMPDPDQIATEVA